jgi:hypothetical protein
MDVLPVPETTIREQTCALAAPLAEIAIAMAAAIPSAIFLIMGVSLADPLMMGHNEASVPHEKVALR